MTSYKDARDRALHTAAAMTTEKVCADLEAATSAVNAAIWAVTKHTGQEMARADVMALADDVLAACRGLTAALGYAGLRIEKRVEETVTCNFAAARSAGPNATLLFQPGTAADLPVDKWPVPALLLFRGLASYQAAQMAILTIIVQLVPR